MTLSEMIVAYRVEHGLSQRSFADVCGVSNGYISMLEKGRNPKTNEPIVPRLSYLQKIASGMGVSLNALLAAADDMDVDISRRVVAGEEKHESALIEQSFPAKEEPATVEGDGLSPEEKDVVRLFRAVDSATKAAMLQLLRSAEAGQSTRGDGAEGK